MFWSRGFVRNCVGPHIRKAATWPFTKRGLEPGSLWAQCAGLLSSSLQATGIVTCLNLFHDCTCARHFKTRRSMMSLIECCHYRRLHFTRIMISLSDLVYEGTWRRFEVVGFTWVKPKGTDANAVHKSTVLIFVSFKNDWKIHTPKRLAMLDPSLTRPRNSGPTPVAKRKNGALVLKIQL